MTNWREEFSRLARYEQSQREKEARAQMQREMVAKSAFCKMMDAYAAIRRTGYDVQVKVLNDPAVYTFNLVQVET